MTIVQWAKKNSRAMGKVALYGTGACLVGYPVIRFGTNLYKGQGVEVAAKDAVLGSYGVDMTTGTINNTWLRNGVVRTGLGALAIYAGRKI